MSDFAARAALARMNMREVAVAAHYPNLANDLRMMANTNPEEAQAAFLARRGELCSAFGLTPKEQSKPFAFASGMAVIPVSGTLVNRFSGSYGFITGYNFIRSQLNAALADEDVTGIILDINSYGGEAAGCFELAADIRAARAQKPILAMVDSNAYSAGYAIASAASHISVTPSGGVGSVGVIAMHVDMSQALTEMGIKVTLIYEGDHKADGNPYEALPEGVLNDMKASIHTSYEAFVKLVSENLGMEEQKVRDTKSRTYRAEDALALGFIHAIATPQKAVQAFFDGLSGSNHQLRLEGNKMSDANKEPGAEQLAATAAAAQQAAQEARIAERARVSGIVGCEEAKGREKLANHLAMNTDMTVDAARAVLACAPAEQQESKPAANAFAAAMNNSQHPNVGASAGASEAGGEGEQSAAARILGAQAQATGLKLVK